MSNRCQFIRILKLKEKEKEQRVQKNRARENVKNGQIRKLVSFIETVDVFNFFLLRLRFTCCLRLNCGLGGLDGAATVRGEALMAG